MRLTECRVDTDRRHRRDCFSDEELELNNNETPSNRLAWPDDPREDPVPHEEQDPHDRPIVQKPKKPATYSGKTGWREYLIHFEMVAKFNKWDDEPKLLS